MQTHLIGQKLINSKGESFDADEILKNKVVSEADLLNKYGSLIISYYYQYDMIRSKLGAINLTAPF